MPSSSLSREKEERELELWLRGRDGRFVLWKRWPICTYSGGLGPKLQEGDGKSPEGFYAVTPGRMNPRSSFHLSFNLGFPNAFDRAHGRTGSVLMVHGACASIGCYAMTDPVIEEIWTLMAAAFRSGQRRIWVHAFPARTTPTWLAARRDAPWYDFWEQLAAGYEAFEQTRKPPRILVRNGRYVVRPRGRSSEATGR